MADIKEDAIIKLEDIETTHLGGTRAKIIVNNPRSVFPETYTTIIPKEVVNHANNKFAGNLEVAIIDIVNNSSNCSTCINSVLWDIEHFKYNVVE